jgi:NB-ARC domain
MLEDELFGRVNEKQMIIDWLTISDTNISVLSLVGIGGVGKTALAQYFFDRQNCIKMWVFVSNTFDVKAITQNILKSLTKPNEEFIDNLYAAQRTLKEKIMGKKFFLVLDDVWYDSNIEEWQKLMAPLRCGSEGSKILLTTRMKSVANMIAKVVGETMMYLKLNGLEEEENLKLFEKYAFAGFDPNYYTRLRSIGKKIAKKLGGIPLSVKVIGAMLNNNLEDKYWDEVLKDGALKSDKGTDGIMAALKLSYEHLSTNLKSCFRYCSIFPHHEFDKDQLVDMWISVGLIPEGKDSHSQEKLAKEFFDTLVQKSFLEYMDPYYVMHDLIHELEQALSKECLQVVGNDPVNIPPSIRHLSLRTSNIEVLKNLSELKYLRTLLLFCNIKDAELGGVIDTVLTGLKTLRCLGLSSKWLHDFPKSIGNLVHLRYLCITRTNIPKLSPCVCNLFHLQILEFTLNSNFDHSERRIPTDISKLSKLKRLHLPSDDISTIPFIGKLTSLQRLTGYSVRGKAGYGISELEMMSELRELEITNLENVRNTDEASKAQLKEKKHLHHITLMWGNGFGNLEGRIESDKDVADFLQPDLNLKDLLLNGYRATNLPSWLNPPILPNLTAINLAYCSILEKLPPFGQLQFLKFLFLEDIGALKKIDLEFYGSSRLDTFPSLETLELIRLVQLEEWEEDTQSEKWFPRLKRLVIVDCPCLKKLPHIPLALKELELNFLEIATLPGFKEQNEGCSTNQDPWCLSSLLIVGCSKLTSLCSGFFMHPEKLASLEELAIWNCAKLAQLPSEGFRELINLKSLRIEQCRGLFVLPMLLPKNFFPPSLQQVMLSSCGDLIALLPHLLPSLSLISLLKLEYCDNLKSLPSASVLQGLKSLKELEIRNCQGLKSLGGLEVITSLKILLIRTCPTLTESLSNSIEVSPENRVSMSLDMLDIDHPKLLLVVPLRKLHSTKSVVIRGSCSMTALPEQWLLQNGDSIHSLVLSGLTLKSVETLPDSLQNLPGLRILALHNAYQLLRLPKLPRSLENLDIYGCSEELAGRLKEGGLDYDKVRNVDVAAFGVVSQSTITRFFS